MIMLTNTEARLIEEVLEETLSYVENEELMESTEELNQALEIIRACNVYSEEKMIELPEDLDV